MLRPLILKVLGLVISIGPLIQLLITILKKGYVQVFAKKERKVQPAILKSSTYTDKHSIFSLLTKTPSHP